MKILYGIQGTGHGHISRAREILPLLSEYAEIDVLLSGNNCQMQLDKIPVDYRKGISFKYDDKGSVSYLKTMLNLHPVQFLKDVYALDVRQYDLVISDFEPVTAWAAFTAGIPSVALSHQASFLSSRSPRPAKKDRLAEQVFKYFAPCHHSIGFHFQPYDSFILPPIIRQEVRELQPVSGNHITVYLPAYSPETLIPQFHKSKFDWQLFSPLCKQAYEVNNVQVFPVGNTSFIESLKSSLGVLTSAGFETCAEAMYLGKKLMVVPIVNQYEQYCNAAALDKMGICVADRIDSSFAEKADNWFQESKTVCLTETADTCRLTEKLIRFAVSARQKNQLMAGR